MNKQALHIKGVCFGEILWDNLPSGRKLGGAPLNVAYHLNKLGIHADLLTRVGNDQSGKDIMSLSKGLGIPLRLFQQDDSQPTSTVEVSIDSNKQVHYEIVYPVAWDFISLCQKDIDIVSEADFLVFGSLCSRSEVSYRSLTQLLKVAKYKIMDVNLRAPFYSKQRIFELLGQADLVKMNSEELTLIAQWMELATGASDSIKAQSVMKKFGCDELIITYGGEGATYYNQKEKFSFAVPALKVQVQDTIGSGDSFLAAFLSVRLGNDGRNNLEEMLEFATTLSAFVTGSTGACPPYDDKTINRFMWQNYLKQGEP